MCVCVIINDKCVQISSSYCVLPCGESQTPLLFWFLAWNFYLFICDCMSSERPVFSSVTSLLLPLFSQTIVTSPLAFIQFLCLVFITRIVLYPPLFFGAPLHCVFHSPILFLISASKTTFAVPQLCLCPFFLFLHVWSIK